MGLLNLEERQELITLLLSVPNARANPTVRNNLLTGQPLEVLNVIDFSNIPLTHAQNIVNGVDPQDLAEPYDAGWPVLILLDQAIFTAGPTHPTAKRLQALQAQLQERSSHWEELSSALLGKPALEPENLERLIDKVLGFQDPEHWRAQMYRRERTVCRVEFLVDGELKPKGTGFLLGRNLLMTNYHVMARVIEGTVLPENVVLRFDYKKEADGLAVRPGREYRLAADWSVDASPVAQLDYSLVRLAENAGDEQVSDAGAPTTRGWLQPQAHEFLAGEPLFILQHPSGEPLKVAFDRVLQIPAGPRINRVTYRTNTEPGSSGSPCFTTNWDLIALHHGYDPNSPDEPNEGIPFTEILKKRQVRDALAN
jgi:hypothetical protein